MAKHAYFTPELLRFLTQLDRHNDREWFAANKQRYEQEGKDPLLRFIADLGPQLAKISRHFTANPKPVGGSMMRIYRDTRFAKDKSPYKTALMAHFQHDAGEEGATPAFFLRIEPGRSVVGAGLWRPESGALKQIRERIAHDAKTWQRVTSGRALGSGCAMAGESLKRPPAGFDPAHPCIEDLKRKDFAVTAPIDDQRVVRADFLDQVASSYRAFAPFLGFVTQAVGLPF